MYDGKDGFRYTSYILNLSLIFNLTKSSAVKQTDPGTKYPVLHTFAIRKHFSTVHSVLSLETVGRAGCFRPKSVKLTIEFLNMTNL